MPTLSTINKLTIIRIQVRLSGDEEEGDQGDGDQMETETTAAGQASSFRSRGNRSRLQPHQRYLQMHFRSFWRGLMDLERSRMSILTG